MVLGSRFISTSLIHRFLLHKDLYHLAVPGNSLIVDGSYIQSFSKSLLDVADNLSRASSVVKESFSKIDSSNNSDEAVPLLKTLLEMTEKQLGEVFLLKIPLHQLYYNSENVVFCF
jgi:hypothetical protein